MSDTIKDWSKVVKKVEGEGIKNDKNYSKHMIKPCKMIASIGPTGSGKSNALLEFLSRKNNSFCEVILFSGSTTDEDLYNVLEKSMDGIQLIDEIDELPNLTDYNNEDKKSEKLIIFDDIINLEKKELKKICKWFNSARKYGFTCIAMCQNWTDMPIQMRRNSHYIFLYRLKDLNQVKQILKGSNHDGIPLEVLMRLYNEASQNVGQFFKIDMTETDPNLKYRKNFIGGF